MSVSLSVSVSVCLSLCLSVCLSVSISLSVCLCLTTVYVSLSLCVFVSICQSVSLSSGTVSWGGGGERLLVLKSLFFCNKVELSVCLSVSLSLSLPPPLVFRSPRLVHAWLSQVDVSQSVVRLTFPEESQLPKSHANRPD